MGTRRRRTKPTPTELLRVQRVLESEPAFRECLGPSVAVTKRTGEIVTVSSASMAVAESMMARGLNPERARVAALLKVAVDVLRPGARTIPTALQPS